MHGAIDTAGELTTGALVARAVEGAEPGAPPAAAPPLCLNCGTKLLGPHCHRCGQSGHVHRSLHEIGHEIAHGVFHFEGKIWRTLPMLVTRPGALTRRYVSGERARLLSPLALFLFCVFVMFAVVSWVGGEARIPDTEARRATSENLRISVASARADLAKVTARRAKLVARGKDTSDVDAQRRALANTVSTLEKVASGLDDGDEGDGDLLHIKTGWAALDKGIGKANENPNLALYKLQSSAYKYSWVLIPISVPFVALLFLWRRRFHLYDHAVFVTYSLSFMMLLVSAITLSMAADLWGLLIALLMVVAPPLHMYKQLRGAYALRRFSALWRTAALTVFALVALNVWLVLLILHGLTE